MTVIGRERKRSRINKQRSVFHRVSGFMLVFKKAKRKESVKVSEHMLYTYVLLWKAILIFISSIFYSQLALLHYNDSFSFKWAFLWNSSSLPLRTGDVFHLVVFLSSVLKTVALCLCWLQSRSKTFSEVSLAHQMWEGEKSLSLNLNCPNGKSASDRPDVIVYEGGW